METINIIHIDLLFAHWFRIGQIQLPWLLLGIGFGGLSIALLVLMLSRLGHARPVQKCVILSVYAHFLLLGFAYVSNFLQDPRPTGRGPGMKVTYIDSDESQDLRSGSEPWEQAQPITSVETAELHPEQPPVTVEVPAPNITLTEFETDISDLLPADVPTEPKPTLEVTQATEAAALDKPYLDPAQADSVTPLANNSESTAGVENLAEQAVEESQQENAQVQALSDVKPDASQGEIGVSRQDRTQASLASVGTAGLASANTKTASQIAGRPRQPAVPDLYRARQGEERLECVLAQGGSRETEQAVEDALEWFASAQYPGDGRWSTRAWGGGQETRDFSNIHSSRMIHADTALTGLALLSFFGAGHTHLNSPYRENIEQGIQFLFSQQSASTGSLAGNAGPFVAMYCHGIATLAISEAYILTGDKRIRPHLDGAIHFTLKSQHPRTGGWRYKPGDTGDTSQFGWQLMSLISARSAGIQIPEHAWQGANRFHQQVSLGKHGGLACYNPIRKVPSHTMTAEALMCRIFLQGSANQAAIEEAANDVSHHGLGQAPTNLYYLYYATLALHQLQDHRWTAWNQAVSKKLVSSQCTTPGKLKGSWNADSRWGRTGGRVYSTALATLCLESYYRYLPFYKSQVRTANHSLANPQRR